MVHPFADAKRVARQANGPGSTPTYHDGKLFVVSLDGTLVCLDAAKGKELWTKSYVDDFGGAVPMWGYNDSVLVDGENVICAPRGLKAAVAALNIKDGEVVWRTELRSGGGGAEFVPNMFEPFGEGVEFGPSHPGEAGKAAGWRHRSS